MFNNDVSLGFANPTGTANSYLLSYRTSAADLGNLNLQARATDDLGNIGFSDLVPVSVITGAMPTVSITSPTDGDGIKTGETLEITVEATDADIDGFITTV